MMIQKRFFWATLFCVVSLCSCRPQGQFDERGAREEILKMHNAQRGYHFGKDSISFVNQLSDDFISVNRGLISRPKKEETLSRYHSYFSTVEFIKWDDVSDPIIRFSADGTLAYTIVDKVVRVRYPGQIGDPEFGETQFAWVSIYRKSKNGWNIESVVSTNKPAQ